MKKTLLFALVPFLSGCGLVLVKGPAPGWETANAEDLETMAVSQPCTNSEILPVLDVVLSGAIGVFGIVGFFMSDPFADEYYVVGSADGIRYPRPARTKGEQKLMNVSIAALAWTPIQMTSGVKSLGRTRDCRAFNARLLQERRGDEQASHEWLNELFPLPDLGVTGLDPVFGVPINQDH